MNYEDIDRDATHRAYRDMGVGMWLPVQTGKHRGRVELIPFDGLHFRTMNGHIIPEDLLFNTKEEARAYLRTALDSHR